MTHNKRTSESRPLNPSNVKNMSKTCQKYEYPKIYNYLQRFNRRFYRHDQMEVKVGHYIYSATSSSVI